MFNQQSRILLAFIGITFELFAEDNIGAAGFILAPFFFIILGGLKLRRSLLNFNDLSQTSQLSASLSQTPRALSRRGCVSSREP